MLTRKDLEAVGYYDMVEPQSSTVYTVWCEYDIGLEGYVFDSLERAQEVTRTRLFRMNIHEDFTTLMRDGVLRFEEKTLVKNMR